MDEHVKSCYLFDGELTYIGDSHYEHVVGALTKFNGKLLSVGGKYLSNLDDFEDYADIEEIGNQKTEILTRDENQNFSWSLVEQDFEFTEGDFIYHHSLVTVESSDINQEYVLLIGGFNEWYHAIKSVFKFNRTWSLFGQLKKPRCNHNSIYWNGAVYVIGGTVTNETYEFLKDEKNKIEIWNVKSSPDKFKTIANWPELYDWKRSILFVIPDSFFPDY